MLGLAATSDTVDPMWIIPCALALGAALGLLLARGDVSAARSTRIKLWPVGLLGIITGAAAGLSLGVAGSTLLLGVSLACFAVVAGTNLRLAGAGIVLLGVTLNLVPLLLNSHVPVRAEAVVASGIVDANELDRVELGSGRAFETSDTQLGILGGVLAVKALGEVFSFGDLIVMAGLLNLGFRIAHPTAVRNTIGRRENAHSDEREETPDELIIDLDSLAAIPPRHTPGLTPGPGSRTLEGSAVLGAPVNSQ
ncbi:MAG: hypothetical protein ACI8Y4_003552 [Candidatus Poriferisodalaceae bacterium]